MATAPGASVTLEQDGTLGVLRFGRADRLHAFDPAEAQAFRLAAAEAAALPIRALIVTGTARAFCAGGDLHVFEGLSVGEIDVMREAMVDALGSLASARFPVIAAVSGACFGGGMEIAATCDVVVASRGARFGFGQGRVGLCPGWGGTGPLVRRIGSGRALAAMLRQSVWTAEEALGAGLVDEVAEDDALEAARSLGSCAAALPAGTVAGLKSVLGASARAERAEALGLERAVFLDLWERPERRERMRGLLNRLASRPGEER